MTHADIWDFYCSRDNQNYQKPNRNHAHTALEENVPSNKPCDVIIVILYSLKKKNKHVFSPKNKSYPSFFIIAMVFVHKGTNLRSWEQELAIGYLKKMVFWYLSANMITFMAQFQINIMGFLIY